LAGKNARADVSIDGGPTVKVAPQAVDTAGQLYTLIKDRRAEGKPDLSRDELIGLAEQGLKTGTTPSKLPTGKKAGAHPRVTQAAAAHLKAHPETRAQFAEIFGEAAAKAILGN